MRRGAARPLGAFAVGALLALAACGSVCMNQQCVGSKKQL